MELLLADCGKLPAGVSEVAEALVLYADASSHGELVAGASGRWRLDGHNYLTLKPQYARANNLAVTLRGNPDEFEDRAELSLQKDQNGYSAFRLERASQAAAAFYYVERAHTLFERGASRRQVTPRTLG